MAEVEKEIEVDVPVREAYNQWTQFEDFPKFMEGVERVEQVDDSTLRWEAEIAGEHEQWEAKITDQEPDRRVAWRSTSGAENAGDVRFEPAGYGKTRVKLHLVYAPEDFKEKVGDMLGVLDRRVEGDLKRFKDFIESRGQATGEWRGEIQEPAPLEGASENPEQQPHRDNS
jgi:uncharacterized membrane protein